MRDLLSPNFVLEEVTRDDLAIASVALGFTLGFGWLATWTALRQTYRFWKRYGTRSVHNTYIWMIWLEIVVCLVFTVICYLYLGGTIAPSFAFYFAILTCWALQVQFLLQIIINRCAILMPDRRAVCRLKFGVALLITGINVSVYNIWIPARLQVSAAYVHANEWWDRCEKVVYLLVDGALNVYFIAIVKRNLIAHGLVKYKRLTHFNIFIICFSLSMDVLIISTMSLSNSFVYMQFHPLAYMVKLNIEMSMANLIAKIAKKKERLRTIPSSSSSSSGSRGGRRHNRSRGATVVEQLSSPFRSLQGAGSSAAHLQPLPPARNAVPFKVWPGGEVDSAAAVAADGHAGVGVPLHVRRSSSSSSSSSRASTLDLSGASSCDLFMLVQEVTVESQQVQDLSMFTPEICTGQDYGDTIAMPIIWDGTPVISTTIGAGMREEEA